MDQNPAMPNDQTVSPEPMIQTTPDNPPRSSSKLPVILILILIIGLIAGGLGYYFLVVKKTKPVAVVQTLPKAILSIDSPQNDQATTSASILIKGKAEPNGQVVAYTDTNEETFESDENGNFEGELVLEEGPNEITITAFGTKNEENSETRSVVFVKEEEL